MTIIELNKTALISNILELKKIIGKTQLGVVVKSNAYGHGIIEISTILNTIPEVEYLHTASLSEALLLRKSKISKKILVLSCIDIDPMEAFKNNIEITIHNFYDLNRILAPANELKIPINIHLKVDTGMNRLGFTTQEIFKAIELIKSCKYVIIHGIFTHLCDTQNIDKSFSYEQLDLFDKLLQELLNKNIHIPITHALSSSGLSIKPDNNYSLIRAGALVYGSWKSLKHKNLVLENHPNLNLKPVLTLKSNIIAIKDVSSNSTIGYDRAFKAIDYIKIAILATGYNDGIPRKLSNKGHVIISKKNILYQAPIIGNISMNLFTIDITNIPRMKIGDEVILISDFEPILSRQVAEIAETISNDILCSLNPNIIRKIV